MIGTGIFLILILLGTYEAYCFTNSQKTSDNLNEHFFLSFCLTFIFVITIGLALAILGFFQIMIINGILCALIGVGGYFLYQKQLLQTPMSVFKLIREQQWNKLAVFIFLGILFLYICFPNTYWYAGRDHGLYVVNGAHIAQTGSIQYQSDPVLSELFEKIGASLKLDYPGLYSAFEYNISNDTGQLIPQFLPLYFIVTAFGYLIGGMPALFAMSGIVSALSLLMLYYFTKHIFGSKIATACLFLMAINPGQLWNGRVPESEILSQLLFFSAAYSFAYAWYNDKTCLATMSGCLLGLSCFCRVDTYIWGIGVLGILFYVCLYTPQRIKLSINLGLSFFAWMLLSLLYGYYFCYPYYYDLWNLGSLKGIVLLNILVFCILLIAMILRYTLLKKLFYCNHIQALFDSKTGLLTLHTCLFLLCIFAYFIRPLFNDSDVYNALAYAMRDFSYYTSFTAVLLAIVGLYVVLQKGSKYRESLYLFLLIGLSSMIGYLYNPSITPDHFWSSRRWVTVCFPFVIILFVVGIYWMAQYLSGIFKYKNVKNIVVYSCIALLSCFFIFQSKLFLYRHILGGTVEQLEVLAENLDNESIYLTNAEQAASPLAYIYGKQVYLLGDVKNLEGLLSIQQDIYFLTKTRPPLDMHLSFEKLKTFGIHGLFCERSVGSYPKFLFDEGFDLELYKISSNEAHTSTIQLEYPNQRGKYSYNSLSDSFFISDKTPNFLLHGVKDYLPIGQYICYYELELLQQENSSDNIGFVDIIDDTGVLSRNNLDVDMFDESKAIIALPFTNSTQKQLEFRLYTNQGVSLQAHSLTVKQISDNIS